ncbi:MAG: RAMP superfamily CRISPR-associated protein [Lachnospiraceae bacterium]|nr:RAMP superfamily CRISPR-associated protein [Lachnospiraceae bacterium]
MKIVMRLLSDTIFGNGESIPGAEDMSVLVDDYGFPYYKGGTLKGIFREELGRYLELTGSEESEVRREIARLLGNSGDDVNHANKLVFSDLCLSGKVKDNIIKEIGTDSKDAVTDALTNLRTFTKIGENGVVDNGSLRIARCVNKGLVFYGDISCKEEDEEFVSRILGLIKGIGTMRNRGFGFVAIGKEE